MKTFNLGMRNQKWVVPPSLSGLTTSSEGPPRASGDEETKASEAKTKLPGEGLLRPGLKGGEERREKRVKSKTRPGKRYENFRMESSYFLEIMTYPLFPLNCYSLADWPRSRNITRTKSLFMYHYVAHK